MDKEEYFSKQEELLEKRTKQFERLKEMIDLRQKILSVGCGVAPSALSTDIIGIDHNPSVIDFCAERHRGSTFICTDYMSYLGSTDEVFNTILALDIDSSIIPLNLLRIAWPKLAKGGSIVLSERQDNNRIYRRYLLSPLIQLIRKEWDDKAKIQVFTRLLEFPDPQDRDNIVLIITKN